MEPTGFDEPPTKIPLENEEEWQTVIEVSRELGRVEVLVEDASELTKGLSIPEDLNADLSPEEEKEEEVKPLEKQPASKPQNTPLEVQEDEKEEAEDEEQIDSSSSEDEDKRSSSSSKKKKQKSKFRAKRNAILVNKNNKKPLFHWISLEREKMPDLALKAFTEHLKKAGIIDFTCTLEKAELAVYKSLRYAKRAAAKPKNKSKRTY